MRKLASLSLFTCVFLFQMNNAVLSVQNSLTAVAPAFRNGSLNVFRIGGSPLAVGLWTQFNMTFSESSIAVILGDLDGDGFPDMFVGDGESESASFIFLGRNPTKQILGVCAPKFGRSVSPFTADVNLDGTPDVLVGAKGTVFLLFLSADGSVGNVTSLSLNWEDAAYMAQREQFGSLVAFGHDLNNDNVPEALITSGNDDMTIFLLFLSAEGTVSSVQKLICGISPNFQIQGVFSPKPQRILFLATRRFKNLQRSMIFLGKILKVNSTNASHLKIEKSCGYLAGAISFSPASEGSFTIVSSRSDDARLSFTVYRSLHELCT